MKFKIYVIFHRTLHKGFYETIPEEMFREKITCIGVNEEIPKSYDPWFEASVIHEHQLENYNPLLQENKYYESSAYHHLATSKIIDQYDYVGCLHYDMKLTKNTLANIQYNIESHRFLGCFFYFALAEGDHNVCNSFGNPNKGIAIWNAILENYNTFFKTSFTLRDILYNNIPMFHSFIMPKHVLQSLTPFIDGMSKEILIMLKEKKNTLPYHLERLWGFCLLLKKLEGVIPTWIPLSDIIHDESVKDAKNL